MVGRLIPLFVRQVAEALERVMTAVHLEGHQDRVLVMQPIREAAALMVAEAEVVVEALRHGRGPLATTAMAE
ncbi:hypothetical protein ACMDCT_14010 [Halomonadaceae bacterium KBTZ08]